MRAVIDGAPTGGRGQGGSACHPSRGCHHTCRKRPWGRSLGDTKTTAPRPHDGKTLTALVVVPPLQPVYKTQRRWTGLPSCDTHHEDTNHTDTTPHENCSHHHPGIRRRRVVATAAQKGNRATPERTTNDRPDMQQKAPAAMDFKPHHLKILPDLEDFELQKGYMRALIQFAEDGVIRDDESDADSVVSTRAGGGKGNTLAPAKAYISCRISSVPAFAWPVDEALRTPDLDAEPTAADTDSILSASTAQSPGPLQETFAPLTLTTSRELNPPHLTALRPPPHPSRKKPSNPLPLLTVQEEPPRRSLSAANSPTNPSLALPLPPGRPSTSTTTTTPSSSSLSASSRRRGGPKSLRSTSPRRSTSDSLLRLFRPSTSTTTAPLERRTLTPHDRLAPVPRQDLADTEAIPPVPAIDPSWDAIIPPPQIDTGGGQSVFGIPLDESVALAPMRIRVSHKGSSVSHRSVPVSVYKCAEYIRATAPHSPRLFEEGTRRDRSVAGLYDVFNTGPGYGANLSFVEGRYTPADAAHLILLYLESLPRPLIPPSVVKSWIVLARRHARPGGVMEEEETLDLWAEALNRLGTMERNLVKLLLELFAVVLGGAEAGGEEERGLAGDVAGGMFHLELGGMDGEGKGGGLLRRISSGRRGRKKEGRGREAVVALGFLVRRRGEYRGGLAKGGTNGLGGEGGFLPSVGEVMGWRGESRKR